MQEDCAFFSKFHLYPTLNPCESSTLTDRGSIFSPNSLCEKSVAFDTALFNSYPSAFASLVYICTSNGARETDTYAMRLFHKFGSLLRVHADQHPICTLALAPVAQPPSNRIHFCFLPQFQIGNFNARWSSANGYMKESLVSCSITIKYRSPREAIPITDLARLAFSVPQVRKSGENDA